MIYHLPDLFLLNLKGDSVSAAGRPPCVSPSSLSVCLGERGEEKGRRI